MAELKSLAKDTAIYGASSIIGKFLNYFWYRFILFRFLLLPEDTE